MTLDKKILMVILIIPVMICSGIYVTIKETIRFCVKIVKM